MILLIILLSPNSSYAVEKNKEGSAIFKTEASKTEQADKRGLQLKRFLESYHSPLGEYSTFIIQVADAFGIPWTLVPAISGVESTFCHHIPVNSFNCWGWNNGKYSFFDYEDAIYTITKSLRYNYFDKGLVNPYLISRIYAPPSSVWGIKVDFFMNSIENFTVGEIPVSSF